MTYLCFFFFKQKTAYEMRISDWSSDVCSSDLGNYDQLWLTTSLRGMTGGNLTVQVLEEGVHSGDASGVVPSSFRILRELLSRLEDPETGTIKPKELYVDIPQQRVDQAKLSAEVLGDEIYDTFPWVDEIGRAPGREKVVQHV